MQDQTRMIHATAVGMAEQAVLLLGPSGSGKSSLALQLIGLGAGLIADDRVSLSFDDGKLMASGDPRFAGLIEARGVGIVRTSAVGQLEVALAVDLARVETERMPPQRNVTLLGHKVPLLWRVETPHFPATLIQILLHGRESQ